MKLKPQWMLCTLLACTGCHKEIDHSAQLPLQTRYPDYQPPKPPENTPDIQAATRFVRVFPGSAKAHYELGLAYYQKDEYRRAIMSFQESLRLAPENSASYFSLGHSYNALGESQRACEVFQQVLTLKLSPSQRSDGYLSLGNCYWDLKRSTDAEKAYLASLKYHPKQSMAFFGLGLVAAFHNENDKAKYFFQEALHNADTTRGRDKAQKALIKLASERGI